MLRGFEGFEGTPYFDRTAFRAGFGSDTTTLADGTVVPVRQGMTVNREDAERDLARRVPEFTQRAERNIGAENFARLPPNAQAALISIAYNYGRIPESLLPAARSGDLTALSQAVAALPANPSRRQSEAAVIAGQGPRLVQANAMVPGATPANAMLAPADAMVRSDVPQLPLDPSAGPLARADYQKRMLDAIQQLEVKRIDAERARADQPARVGEAGQTSEAQTRGRLTAEQERENRRKQEGRENIEKVLEDMKASYQRLEELRGIPSERRGAAANIPAYLGATPPGQELGKALATPSQSQRNALQASGRQLLTAIKAATGMSAQEMNSNVELQQLMAAISSPTQSIESVREILTRISRNYGSGRLEFGAPAETPAAAAPAPAAAPRDGVPSQRRGAAAPAQGQYREGQTATGPNGQRVIFRGGQWVPVQ
jgi:GH24 family phage-related lysozyme (muramidase)